MFMALVWLAYGVFCLIEYMEEAFMAKAGW